MKKLVIETGIEKEYEQALIASAKKIGWSVHEIMHVPFSDMFCFVKNGMFSDPVPKELLNDSEVWYHGSISGAKAAQRVTKWQVHAPWFALRCSVYYKWLEGLIFQQNHEFSTIEQLPLDKERFFSEIGIDGTLFVRPDGNGKEFNGGCIHKESWDDQFKLITFYDPPPDTKIVVAKPQKVQAEARFLIVDQKLITGSYYRAGGQAIRLKAEDLLLDVARHYLGACIERGYNPAPSWVLDLAQVNSEWKIIEVGASSCCGLYKCDTDAFMTALNKAL